MSAEDSTPCQEAPEAWVGDNDRSRAEAARECAKCPLHMFAACQKLARIEPFGVMAGVDYGTTIKSAARVQAHRERRLLPEDVKECEHCHDTIRRGRRGKHDWDKLRFCSRTCYGSANRVTGLPEVKSCELCGSEFARGDRGPTHWLAMRFCGVDCSAASRRKGAAA